ncbi:hypothetical protein CALCODRAFT_486520 [Calocera cornea HHB12733]|uniref:Uncharacterized protein n=1 Tax=Calocera cornea HHB12733 TaxID=1353952 RepID=A0A165DNX3_9BASI|nr:hypothetical protein CALCODRAFT_486520 [Calocera cornea HHB12733]
MPSPKSSFKGSLSPPLLPQHAPHRITPARTNPRVILDPAPTLLSRLRGVRAYLCPGDATPLLILMTFCLWACVLLVSTGLDMGKNVALEWVGRVIGSLRM